MTHTPGPWAYHKYLGNSGTNFGVETADHRHGIAAIRPSDTASTMLTLEQHEANARLIAVSPEMWEWMQSVLQEPERFSDAELDAAEKIGFKVET